MHLATCSPPDSTESLETAPPPSAVLLSDPVDGERWDGFWSPASDGYYVRRTLQDGATEWYQVADDATALPRQIETRVIELRPQQRARNHAAVIVARSPSGRRMLVGTAGRAAK
jgi:hypothetical protein